MSGRGRAGDLARLQEGLFLLLLACLPLDATTLLAFEVQAYQVSGLDLAVIALAYLSWLRGTLEGFRLAAFPRRALWLLLFAAATSAVSLLYLPLDRRAFDLKITLNLLEYSVLLYAASSTLRDLGALRRAFRVLLATVCLLSALTALKSLGLDIPGDVRHSARPVGPFLVGVTAVTDIGAGFALVLLAGLPAALVPAATGLSKQRLPILFLILLAGLLSYSRTLWVAMAVELLVCLGLAAWAAGRRYLPIAPVALLLVVVLGLLLGPGLYGAVVDLRPATVAIRLQGFADSLDLASRDPVHFLFGSGKGNWVGSFGMVPHNLALDLLVAKGVVTLLLVLALLALLGARLLALALAAASDPIRRAGAELGLIMLAGVLAQSAFDVTTTSFPFWAAIVTLVASVPILSAPAAPGSRIAQV